MKHKYHSCPVCRHPNIHADGGKLAEHTIRVTDGRPCAGSGASVLPRDSAVSRGSEQYRRELEQWDRNPRSFAPVASESLQERGIQAASRYHTLGKYAF